MANVPLSPATLARLQIMFPGPDRADAAALLIAECGSNLPFFEDADEFKLERIRYAALKLSEGNMEKLKYAVKIAKQDWRDVLVASGFGHDPRAHERWMP